MTADGKAILEDLATVGVERRRRVVDATLGQRVVAVKAFQHARFSKTYADLLGQPRYGDAARFFLEDLYGPSDFTQRDEQFARIVPAMVRLFPHDIIVTVGALAALHALSETMDTLMALALDDSAMTAARYVRAWQSVGRAPDRERQVALTMAVGTALDGYTRNPLLRHSLRLMRGPARAAGMGALQSFLEKGFDTFRGMKGATGFLGTIAGRERTLARELFAADPAALGTGGAGVLALLP